MKRAILPLALTSLFHQPAIPAQNVGKTDKEKEGLIGPVRTVLIERARFSEKDGKRVEGPRVPTQKTTYDMKGHKTEEICYGPGRSVSKKSLCTYDAKGSKVEEAEYS